MIATQIMAAAIADAIPRACDIRIAATCINIPIITNNANNFTTG
jgi:hypothetical protein